MDLDLYSDENLTVTPWILRLTYHFGGPTGDDKE